MAVEKKGENVVKIKEEADKMELKCCKVEKN